MSIGSDIRYEPGQIEVSSIKPTTSFSNDAIPYLLSIADAFVILLASLAGGFGYQLLVGNPIPDTLPPCAVGLLAGLIHTLRMNGRGYYDFPDSAKPRVEISEILVCWFTTGLLLALFAFLLKIGVAYSRGAFVIFYFLTPVALLGVRKLTKIALAAAVARGTIGRDMVLIGDSDEIAAFEPRDLLAFFGVAEVRRFMLSREDDPLMRASADVRVVSSAANFVRSHNCREILLALPWDDVGRIEFVRDQIKTLPVAARLLPDMRVRSLTNYISASASIGRRNPTGAP